MRLGDMERKGVTPKDCRSCGAKIVFLNTRSGKKMPVDAESWTPGETEYDPRDAGHTSHFASCTEADEHRRPR